MFFDHYFASTGMQPNETVLVDDSANYKVVERLGMDFRHVTAEATKQLLYKLRINVRG